MRKLLISVALLALSFHAMAEELDPHSIVSVRLERTACFGTCPQYSLVVSRNGMLLYRGTEYVKVRGRRTGKISQKDFSRLADAAVQVKFLSFRDQYPSVADTCNPYVTDGPSIKIGLQFINGAKSVDYYTGCQGLAEMSRIEWLAKTIDEMARSSQWVGSR